MSQAPAPRSPPTPQPAASPPAPPPVVPRRQISWLKRLTTIAIFLVPFAAGLLLLIPWIVDRRTHSITDDGFVESHIVNVAPEIVSGRIVRFLVDENDSIQQGEIIAEIDPEPYLDRVHVAQARLDTA